MNGIPECNEWRNAMQVNLNAAAEYNFNFKMKFKFYSAKRQASEIEWNEWIEWNEMNGEQNGL